MACKLPWVGSVFILSILLFANPIRADEVTEEEKELVAKVRLSKYQSIIQILAIALLIKLV